MTRDEWFAKGLNDRAAPRTLTDGELLLLQFRIGKGGRNAKENDRGWFSPEHKGKGGHTNRKNKTGIFALRKTNFRKTVAVVL